MAYLGIELNRVIHIKKIYSIHYFEYMNDFSFRGESHDFWEFICVDEGEAYVTAGDSSAILKKSNIAFHHPNEFHNVQATGKSASNLVVISFECDAPAMEFFRHKILMLDETERNLLADIIVEARRCFDCRLDDPYLQNMPLKECDIFGTEQLVLLHLEHFLIHLIRRHLKPSVMLKKYPKSTSHTCNRKRSDTELFKNIVDYLELNLALHITIEQICRANQISRSRLQNLFKEKTGMGIIEYYSHMKINAAKSMIRTQNMNFTQISEQLGYTSIHYFSRQFKKITRITPSEYASSIKAMADGRF